MDTIINTIKENWDEILKETCREYAISSVSYKTWLTPLSPHHMEEDKIFISVDFQEVNFAIDILNRKYKLPLQVTIGELIGSPCEVVFIASSDVVKEEPVKQNRSVNPSFANLNSKYTFDNFVVGNYNRFAYNAALAVAESPGEFYNPLYLYGGAGLGKTHLMHAIAHFILDNNPNANVLYVTSDVFTNELIESIRQGNVNAFAMTKFREKYRNIDVLLIDDIQFIIGKESTQEEFFHTFNHLHLLKKQIIISSDRPPKEIKTLEERLRTRFEMGLIADISAPDYETRMAILRKKEEQEGISIPDDIIDYIAVNITSNVRELEGALHVLKAFTVLSNPEKELNLKTAEDALKDYIFPDSPKKITPELIISTVSEHFNVSAEDICSHKRNANIVYPRQIVMYLCRELDDTSLQSVGKLLGGRDHSTIIHGSSKIAELVQKDERTKSIIDILRKKLSPV